MQNLCGADEIQGRESVKQNNYDLLTHSIIIRIFVRHKKKNLFCPDRQKRLFMPKTHQIVRFGT